ncbi:hypothetical protein [Arthrobacter sp. zg-Y1143]|nr:hypothetical protein [Arthrobacter sp. zg-Y1143]MDK1326580.1 hypothetical protein [Arthrobacter sp. zg-Y1143]
MDPCTAIRVPLRRYLFNRRGHRRETGRQQGPQALRAREPEDRIGRAA